MASKRTHDDDAAIERSPQRRALAADESSIREASSIRQRAERYRLATAKMPLDSLTCTWTRGKNRRLQQQQVSRLCDDFRELGLEREAEENFLLVQCSAAAVEQMLGFLGVGRLLKDGESARDRTWSFHDWLVVNSGEEVEVMAGQHRMAALRQYATKTGSDTGKLWWTCYIYDADSLPRELDMQLRMNRRGSSLPDSAADMWMQLVQAQEQDGRLFHGNKAAVQKRMREVLRLGGGDTFPAGRVVTLWRNDRWRSMITRWCRTEVGRGTFTNISTWEWMASLRIDNYWFSVFEEVLGVLHSLPCDGADSVTKADWAEFVKALGGRAYGESEAMELFYPERDDEMDELAKKRRRRQSQRRKGFLRGLGDAEYDAVFRHIVHNGSHTGTRQSFPDVEGFLKTKKDEGQIMRRVMEHVVRWVNGSPYEVVDNRDNNKPLLRGRKPYRN
ncbi:hypothetical protein MGU_11700 [Metarhizium guizhouense ARSEF 977]|uniref:Uncharacterized protein n=1 Tax=Metarhizium guizhouense (strain ARSEF 977) TaxID=1276136 RepID=A0A0B4GMF8_METGA|nr:hypothetical protein MGU_11700 [Metarhizium guizhouense ARSEF 977]